MIKLFSLKQQKKEGIESGEKTGSQKKSSAAQLRIQKGTIMSLTRNENRNESTFQTTIFPSCSMEK